MIALIVWTIRDIFAVVLVSLFILFWILVLCIVVWDRVTLRIRNWWRSHYGEQ